MNGRDDLRRAAVYKAHAAKGTEAFDAACRDIVDGWMLWPLIEAERELENARRLRDQHRARLGQAADWVRDSYIEAREPDLCQLCQREAPGGWCAANVAPDCTAEARRRLGVPEFEVRRLRAREWRALIEKREGRAA